MVHCVLWTAVLTVCPSRGKLCCVSKCLTRYVSCTGVTKTEPILIFKKSVDVEEKCRF